MTLSSKLIQFFFTLTPENEKFEIHGVIIFQNLKTEKKYTLIDQTRNKIKSVLTNFPIAIIL